MKRSLLSPEQAYSLLEHIPVHRDDQALLDLAVNTGDWKPVTDQLSFRISSGKNFERTLLLARAWYWWRQCGAPENCALLERLITHIQERGAMC